MDWLVNLKTSIRGNPTLVSLYFYKGIYQIIYILFNFTILKKLSVAEFGNYSFLLAVIVYFQSFIALGFPIYVQKKYSTGEPFSSVYFRALLLNIFIAIPILFFFIDLELAEKGFLLVILFSGILSSFISTLYNAIADYAQQYKLLLFGSLWQLALLLWVVIYESSISVELILCVWGINCLLYFGFLLFLLRKFIRKFSWTASKIKLHHAMWALFTIYAVSFPYEFSRFFDKWLIKEELNDTFLGLYAFNLFIVATIQSFFIRPLSSVLITNLSIAKDEISQKSRVVKNYLIFVFFTYLALIVSYFPLSNWLLGLVSLTEYQGTNYILIFLIANTFFYSISVPAIITLNLGDSNKNRLRYVGISVLLFIGLYASIYFGVKSEIQFLTLFLLYNALSCISIIIITSESRNLYLVVLKKESNIIK